MESNFKRGLVHPWIITFIAALFLLFGLLIFRKNIHAELNSSALRFGFNLNSIASNEYQDWINSQGDELRETKQAIFLNKNVLFKDAIAEANSHVLGETTASGEKWVEVDISDQKLYLKQGAQTVGSFLVSTGKWYPTPKGEWRIWTKLRYTRMRGGSRALGTFYDLPNVPYTMYYNKGYGIHGAYWHNNFGQPMSHGCVNMKPEEAGIVFDWTSVGTKVVVHQ